MISSWELHINNPLVVYNFESIGTNQFQRICNRVILPALIPYSDWYYYLSSILNCFSLSLLCR
ncbi:hypothetical protein [Shigella phage ESh19]|nr:hypothetical protein [Shigella phage ESh19]URY12546.1 hypothetical protein [Shigella phage ESh20]